MDINKFELERAFELARSGHHRDIHTLISQLKVEGYAGNQVEGKSLRMQLALLIEKSIAEAN
jgi:hypothetical protein